MPKIENKAAQAAIELAVFGAILVFILGTIVRTALSNAYTQNESFKAMRMAMLSSWKGAEANPGKGAQANLTHNNASILIVEDRLSPDFNKYGPLDRNPYIASGSGTFTFNLYYPWQPGLDPPSNLSPIMDVWINGQHFPFTTANYVTNTITRTACQPGGPYETFPLTQGQCMQNQCLRNAREWSGGTVNAGMFSNILPVATFDGTTAATMAANAQAIFSALVAAGVVATTGTPPSTTNGYVTPGFATMPSPFSITDPVTGLSDLLTQDEINNIQTILLNNMNQYKLFYTRTVNGTPQFITTPPQTCSGTDNALCSSLTVLDAYGNPYTNTNGDMQYDLVRNGVYVNATDPNAVETQFPVGGQMRSSIAWQWAASPGTSAASIGLDLSSNQYPTYDIDGRLKEVTIYGISDDNSNGAPTVSYEDFQGGDIDATWDSDSCGPKPGLQPDTQIYTFTMAGTYLEIKEGSLYDPETDQFVRSANKRDTIDMIQRTIQLSNNTGDFCNGTTIQNPVNGSPDANPVEVCIPSGDNCFTTANIAHTCFDASDNRIFVRSRLLDQRGHYWMTDTSGQLLVQ